MRSGREKLSGLSGASAWPSFRENRPCRGFRVLKSCDQKKMFFVVFFKRIRPGKAAPCGVDYAMLP